MRTHEESGIGAKGAATICNVESAAWTAVDFRIVPLAFQPRRTRQNPL